MFGLKGKIVLVLGMGSFVISFGRKFEFDRKLGEKCINLNFKHGEFFARR